MSIQVLERGLDDRRPARSFGRDEGPPSRASASLPDGLVPAMLGVDMPEDAQWPANLPNSKSFGPS